MKDRMFKLALERNPHAVSCRIAGQRTSFKGLLDFNFKKQKLDGVVVSSRGPILLCASEDVLTVGIDTELVIDGKAYPVIAKHEDPFGRCQLSLRKDQGLDSEKALENETIFYEGPRK